LKGNKENGFTLIEVLVASAILFVSMGTILQIFIANLEGMEHSAKMAQSILAERQVLKKLKGINPAIQKSGEGSIEGISYQWTAQKESEGQEIRLPSELKVLKSRVIGLYKVQVEMQRNQKQLKGFSPILLGWK